MPRRAILIGFVFLSGMAADARAAGPVATRFFPPGCQRGSEATVQASGEFPRWPVKAWVSGSGLSAVAGAKPGELQFHAASDAVPGVRWVRLYDEQGASEPRPFVVGTLPEIVEHEPNDQPRSAQTLERPVTINGRLATLGDADVFAVHLPAGRTLVARCEAERPLGSPMDGVLQVLDSAGCVVAENHDHRGLDPGVTFHAPREATYCVRLFAFPAKPTAAIQLAGGDDFIYRLTVTCDEAIDYAFPLAVGPGKQQIELRGWNLLPETGSITVDVPKSVSELTVFRPGMIGYSLVQVTPGKTAVDTEPNEATRPQRIELPTIVSGTIGRPGDVDVFEFDVPDNQTVAIRVESASLGFPLDAALRLADTDDNECAVADDTEGRRDPELIYSVALAGIHRLSIRDLYRHGGPRYAYRLHAGFAEPDYSLDVGTTSFAIPQAGKTELTIAVARANGFSEPIRVEIQGLPATARCQAAESRTDDGTGSSVTLSLQAGDRPFSGPIRIVGTSGKHPARAAEAPVPDSTMKTSDLWLTITP